MADIVASVSKAVSIAKDLLDVMNKTKNAQAKILIADLQVELANVKTKVADLTNENTELREQLRKREEQPKLEMKNGVYFLESGDGPYCPSCHGDTGKLIPVSEFPKAMQDLGKYECNICGGGFGKP